MPDPDGSDPGELRPAGRWLRVLSREEFSRMMGYAVESALIERGTLIPARARLLSRDALRRFASLVQRRSRRVRGVSRGEVLRELERSHDELVRDRERLAGEIGRLEEGVRAAREAVEKAPPPVEPRSLAQDEALRADLERLLASPTPRATLEEVLRCEAERRERALASVRSVEQERVDLLERRLTKLRAALAQQERELAELARRAQLDPGVASIYREVQGLSPEASDREAKAQLLRSIFEQNLMLQGKG